MIIELLIECPVLDMKYIVCGLLRTAMLKVSENDQKIDYRIF